MEAYQPIYDAVRSRLSNGDIGQAVEAVLREVNFSHYVERAAVTIIEEVVRVSDAHAAPSAVYRPSLTIDGNQWCVRYTARTCKTVWRASVIRQQMRCGTLTTTGARSCQPRQRAARLTQ